MAGLLSASLSLQVGWLCASSRGGWPHGVIWLAGIIAVLGLLITWDAYRRWLVTDFD